MTAPKRESVRFTRKQAHDITIRAMSRSPSAPRISEDELARLEELAGKTTPGPWKDHHPPTDSWVSGAYPGPIAAYRLTGSMNVEFVVAKGMDEPDAAYIAALSPDVVLRLIAAARVEDAIRLSPQPEAGLDAAWAEAEAALPEGAWIGTIHPEAESQGEYAGPLNQGSNRIAFVAVRRTDAMSAEYIGFESGPTPAAALLALARSLAALREPKP